MMPYFNNFDLGTKYDIVLMIIFHNTLNVCHILPFTAQTYFEGIKPRLNLVL